MRKSLTIMWKDLAILFRDWAAVVLIIAGPLVLTVGMGLVTGSFGDDAAPAVGDIPVLIVDQDGGSLAAALRETLTSDDLSALLAPAMLDDAAEARARVARGEASAAVIIPPGFSDSLTPDPASGAMPEPVAVEVVSDPGAPIGASIVGGIVESFVAQVDAGVATVRIALSELAASGAVAPADLPAAGAAMAEQVFAGGGETAAPVIVRRETAAVGGGDDFNPLAYFAPAMALLFLMYAVTLGARTLLAERREGTLARMLAAPVTNSQVLGGKVAAIFMGGFIQLGALIVLTTLLFRLSWGQPLGVALLVFAAALAATGWGVLIASAAANAGQVTSLGMALTLIFGILGGSFAPLQDAWPALDVLSRITPNRWALDGFTALAAGDGLAAALLPIGALLLMAALLFAVAAVVFRRRQGTMLIG